MNDGETESARALQIERPVVNEDALFGPALGDGERDTEDCLFRFSRVDVAGTEENLEALTKIKRFDAELVKLQRFVVDGADKVFVRTVRRRREWRGSREIPWTART